MAPAVPSRSTRLGAICAGATVAALGGEGALSFITSARGAPGAIARRTAATSDVSVMQSQPAAFEAAAGTGRCTFACAGAVVGVALLAASGRAAGGSRRTVTRATAVAVSIGQKVDWKGNSGTVKYTGPVGFADGEWVGVELDEPKGIHDGTVFDKSYFTCQPKHGIFCLESDLVGGAMPAAAPAPAGGAAPAAVAAGGPVTSVAVGQKVTWKGNPATVMYMGPVQFAAGEWVGLQLDEAKGMHDGSVFNVQYFSCPPKTGAFCQASELMSSGGAVAAAPSPAAAVAAAPVAAPPAPTGSYSIGQRVTWSGFAGTVRFCGSVDFAAGEWVGVELDSNKGLHDGTVFGKPYFSCQPMHGIFAQPKKLTDA